MKVIFLDHDGVVCLSNNWGGRFKKRAKFLKENSSASPEDVSPVEVRFDDFDKKAIKVLNKILSETDAEIVVSSDWKRHATLEELGDYYTQQGVIKKPIALTGYFEDLFPSEWTSRRFRADLEFERAKEITHWLSENKNVTNWVAVDDLNMSEDFLQDSGLSNFVHTPKSNEGIKQVGIKEKILSFLI